MIILYNNNDSKVLFTSTLFKRKVSEGSVQIFIFDLFVFLLLLFLSILFVQP